LISGREWETCVPGILFLSVSSFLFGLVYTKDIYVHLYIFMENVNSTSQFKTLKLCMNFQAIFYLYLNLTSDIFLSLSIMHVLYFMGRLNYFEALKSLIYLGSHLCHLIYAMHLINCTFYFILTLNLPPIFVVGSTRYMMLASTWLLMN
jgi:hypothetical protein